MTDKYHDEKITLYSTRYFIKTDSDSYVVAMFVACTEAEAEQCESAKLTEVSAKVYESIGPNSKYIGGAVVQGLPRNPVLDTDAKRAILAARLRTATEQISLLQDAVDLEMATDTEQSLLLEWKKHRVLLSRIDPATTDIESWPVPPAT